MVGTELDVIDEVAEVDSVRLAVIVEGVIQEVLVCGVYNCLPFFRLLSNLLLN